MRVNTLPWLLPLLAGGTLIAVLACRPFGRLLDAPWWAAFILLEGLAVVIAVTLTPQRNNALALDPFAVVPEAGAEPLVRPPWQWWPIDDRTLNVLILVPVGFAVMWVGRTLVRRVLIVIALLLPLFVESTQHVLTWLDRDSQWQDVADNTTGVLLGLGLGWLMLRVGRARNRARRVRSADGPLTDA